MHRAQLRRICLILLVLVLLTISIGTLFALAERANCCVKECVPCFNLANLHAHLRYLGSGFSSLAGLLFLLTFLHLILSADLHNQHTTSLVTLKTRLNN
ncbi:MAG: hypothetical protein FWE12_03375 [Oscillospiraceae bacterium]|nr:hypothetical protein [Oscillospiraceae bacterium]